MTQCLVRCAICACDMDWHKSYGRDVSCCCKACYDEFEWRRTLSILDKPYRPDPRKEVVKSDVPNV